MCWGRCTLQRQYPQRSIIRLSVLLSDNPPSKGFPLSTSRGRVDNLHVVEPWEPSSVCIPRVPIVILLIINVKRIPLIYYIFVLQIHCIGQLY